MYLTETYLNDILNNIFDESNYGNNHLSDTITASSYTYTEGDVVTIETALPGCERNDIEIEYVDGKLSITAKEEEKQSQGLKFNGYKRSYQISVDDFNIDDITAEYKDGILKVFIPKSEPKKKKTFKVK